MKTIAIVNASGAVGRWIVNDLLSQSESVAVRALVQDRSDLDTRGIVPGALERLRLVTGDSASDQTLRTLLDGVDGVIDCSEFSVPGDSVEGARVLVQSATRAGVRRIVRFSSASVYAKRGRALYEESSLDAKSEEAQNRLRVEAAARGDQTFPEIVVLRPALIIGVTPRKGLGGLLTWSLVLGEILGSVPEVQGGPHLSWVDARDLARAAVHILTLAKGAEPVYNVAGPEPIQVGSLLKSVCHALGLRGGRTFILGKTLQSSIAQWTPPLAVQVLSTLGERYWDRVRARENLQGDLSPALSPGVMQYFRGDWLVDSSRLEASGFKYLHTRVSEALESAVADYRECRRIPMAAPKPQSRMATGFQFDEVMTGHLDRGGRKSSLEFAITSFAPNLGTFLRDGKMKSFGHMTIDGVATRSPCEGDLEMPVRSRWVHIRLRFLGDSGQPLVYVASKKLTVLRLVRDITTFIGHVEDESGQKLGTSIACFDLRHNTGMLLRSIRLVGVAARLEEMSQTP